MSPAPPKVSRATTGRDRSVSPGIQHSLVQTETENAGETSSDDDGTDGEKDDTGDEEDEKEEKQLQKQKGHERFSGTKRKHKSSDNGEDDDFQDSPAKKPQVVATVSRRRKSPTMLEPFRADTK